MGMRVETINPFTDVIRRVNVSSAAALPTPSLSVLEGCLGETKASPSPLPFPGLLLLFGYGNDIPRR